TVRAAANLVVNVPSGMIVDLIGRRGLLMALAMAFTGIPYLFVGLSHTYFWVLLFMAFVGVGNYLWHPAAMSTLSEKYPQRRGFAIAMHAVGPNVGESLAPLIVGVLLLYFSWRNALFLNLIPGLVIVVVLWKFLFTNPEIGGEKRTDLSLVNYLAGIKAMAQNSHLLLLVGVAGLRAMTQTGLHTFLPIYLTHQLGLSTALVGLYVSAAQTAGMISTPLAGGISDRTGRKRVITTGLVSTSLILVVLATFKLTWLFIAVLALLGFFLYAIRPVI
ncbi:MAG: MFS transporter, partial [Deltaproteobacteria bacterium]|nr:MFS transporter [Deltaproteobacteria bacterium]